MATAGVATTSPLYRAVEFASGAILVVGPALWGVWTAIQRARQKKAALAIGVASGINLAVQGQALASDGSVLTTGSTTPPKPVTVQAAQEIVAKFAPKAA